MRAQPASRIQDRVSIEIEIDRLRFFSLVTFSVSFIHRIYISLVMRRKSSDSNHMKRRLKYCSNSQTYSIFEKRVFTVKKSQKRERKGKSEVMTVSFWRCRDNVHEIRNINYYSKFIDE